MHTGKSTRARERSDRVIHSRASRGRRTDRPRSGSNPGVLTISTEAIAAALAADRIPYLDSDWISAGAVRVNDGQRLDLVLGFHLGDRHEATLEHLRAICSRAAGRPVNVSLSTEIGTHAVQAGLRPLARIHNIIAVASGKGGVGKSTVSANLALALLADGARVGLLDADIYGPSQPRMMGTSERPQSPDGKTMLPVMAHGLATMSIGYLIDASEPTIWRGPMVTQALQQLLTETQWPELDYLIIDLPPGTGDTQLSLVQRIPVSGSVIVTTPQDIALLDARKGLEMFRKVQVPVLGVIENMAYHRCGNCGEVSHIFGEGGGQRLAEATGVPVLGQLPLDAAIQLAADGGRPTVIAEPASDNAQAYREIARRTAAGLAGRVQGQGSRFPDIVIVDD